MKGRLGWDGQSRRVSSNLELESVFEEIRPWPMVNSGLMRFNCLLVGWNSMTAWENSLSGVSIPYRNHQGMS